MRRRGPIPDPDGDRNRNRHGDLDRVAECHGQSDDTRRSDANGVRHRDTHRDDHRDAYGDGDRGSDEHVDAVRDGDSLDRGPHCNADANRTSAVVDFDPIAHGNRLDHVQSRAVADRLVESYSICDAVGDVSAEPYCIRDAVADTVGNVSAEPYSNRDAVAVTVGDGLAEPHSVVDADAHIDCDAYTDCGWRERTLLRQSLWSDGHPGQ